MKFRCLTNEELKELENEFKHFLIANNVYDEEWVKLNKIKDNKVNKLIEMFSDIVIDKALQKIKFLEHIDETGIKAFFCKKEEIELIGISSKNKKFNFKAIDLTNDKFNIFKTSKKYLKTRNEEVFELLNTGCSIINEDRYKKIELAYIYSAKKNKN